MLLIIDNYNQLRLLIFKTEIYNLVVFKVNMNIHGLNRQLFLLDESNGMVPILNLKVNTSGDDDDNNENDDNGC